MPVEIARNALNPTLICSHKRFMTGEIHFLAVNLLKLGIGSVFVEFAVLKAKEERSSAFEAVTNGFYSKPLAEWGPKISIRLSFRLMICGCQIISPSKEENLLLKRIPNARLFSGSDWNW